MKRSLFFFLTNIFLLLNLFSQTVGVTGFMRLNPYSTQNNPAYFLPYNLYVAIPGISNVSFAFYNTGFHYKKLFITDRYGKPQTVTPHKFVNSLHSKNNWLNTEMNLELLGFGFRIKDYFFSFNYQLKMEEQFRYNKDLFGFILQGNLAQGANGEYLYTQSSPANLELSPNLNIYQEIGIRFQGQFMNRLYVGVRPKILFGLYNLKTENFNAKVYTNPDDYTIYGNYDVSVNMSSVVPFYSEDKNGNVVFNSNALFRFFGNVPGAVKSTFSRNPGFAIDLGAVYRINQQIRVSLAVSDLGFIKWRATPINMSIKPLPEGKDYEFSGFTTHHIKHFLENGISLDSIVNNNFVLKTVPAYTTMLTSKIMADGYFDLTPSNRFIMQFKGFIMGRSFLPQFTLAYNGTFFNAIDVVVSYSMMKKSFANLGLGAGFRMGPMHLYFGTDNLFAAINVFNATKMNFTFGLLVNLPIREKVIEPQLTSLFIKKKEPKEPQE